MKNDGTAAVKETAVGAQKELVPNPEAKAVKAERNAESMGLSASLSVLPMQNDGVVTV